ncbi:hypothetical protein ANN_11574 [Periplaneta americana]|uniref:Uncharacterized protein n=1 Tax=Periplaneta americana TaxID=6978 RepID=A0ABQ8T5E2_PERAM|nr:hypothetical protein ANN_11574 [Periplaneta americana]
MSPGSNTESYPALAHIGLRENPGKNLNQRDLVIKEKRREQNQSNGNEILRRTAGYTLLDRKRNEEILEQLEVESVEEKISRYKFNWLDHVRRMENSRIPKIMMQYKPRGHRRPGRPLTRLLDGAETVSEKARASKPAGVRLECASASASASESLSSSAVDRSWRDLSSSAVDRSWRDPSSSTVNYVEEIRHSSGREWRGVLPTCRLYEVVNGEQGAPQLPTQPHLVRHPIVIIIILSIFAEVLILISSPFYGPAPWSRDLRQRSTAQCTLGLTSLSLSPFYTTMYIPIHSLPFTFSASADDHWSKCFPFHNSNTNTALHAIVIQTRKEAEIKPERKTSILSESNNGNKRESQLSEFRKQKAIPDAVVNRSPASSQILQIAGGMEVDRDVGGLSSHYTIAAPFWVLQLPSELFEDISVHRVLRLYNADKRDLLLDGQVLTSSYACLRY